MKLQNKLVLLASLFATFGMFGCENDSDSASCGLNKEMCQSANKSFDANKCLCVDNTPTCNLTQESCQNEGKKLDAVKCECVTESDGSLCPTGKHVFGNTCEDDSLQNCGQHGFDCTTMVHGWTAGECLNGACDATACTTGFHTFNHICEANTPQNCGSHDNTCSVTVPGWKTGVCQNGACQALTCIENMHTEEGVCVADNAEHCGPTQINCTQTVAGWSTGSCIEGKCQVATCANNYHFAIDKCVADTNTCCGLECTNCENSNQMCSLGKCKIKCDTVLTSCGDECVDTKTNISHCGDCDTDCNNNIPAHADAMFCSNSQCIISTCEAGYLLKEGKCVACEEVEGYAKCNGTCIYIANDNDNCGKCGNKCDGGLTCGNGHCLGNIFCSGVPYNTANSIDACGECGHRCENGKVCTDGACVSGQGSMYCDDILINTFSDSANCNGCDNNCAQGYSCSNGSCQTYTFNSSYTLTCDGETVYPYNDSSNCGKCGNDCGKGKYCKAGFCTTEPTTLSTTTYCDGILVEPYADFSNCGGCGISCSATQICFAGTCKSKSSLVIGDIIVFGHYEQDNDMTNGKEPITWRILDINASGQYLLISEKALDVQPYNTTRIDITWEKSTIRSWLNGYDADSNSAEKSYISDNFIDAAFTDKEKNKIQSVDVPAHANPQYNTPPGNATNDKIFLLSITEAQTYFTVDATRQAEATRVAVQKGAFVYGSESGERTTDGTCTDVHCLSYWWLRSPGYYEDYGTYVYDTGIITTYGVGVGVTYNFVAVRPALWVEL